MPTPTTRPSIVSTYLHRPSSQKSSRTRLPNHNTQPRGALHLPTRDLANVKVQPVDLAEPELLVHGPALGRSLEVRPETLAVGHVEERLDQAPRGATALEGRGCGD